MALVMSTMPDVWRKVLAEHVEDGTGRCRACRNADGETAAWPCQTFRVAQEAKWVAEGNLPGTGPHGSQGPSATPRLSPLDDPRRAAPGGADRYGDTRRHDAGGPAGADFGGFNGFGAGGGLGTGGWDLPGSRGADHPGTGGWDLPGSRGADHPGTVGWDVPGAHRDGEFGAGRSWDLDGPVLTDPQADDAATAFGGRGASAPALASLPPLPPAAPPEPPPMPSTPSWRDDPLGPGPVGDDPWDEPPSRHSAWAADEGAPYGSRVDAPYGSTFGVDDRPRGSRH